MINLKINEVSLQFLGVRSLDSCPEHKSTSFVDGYLAFVDVFFDMLECASLPFPQGDGSYNVDLEIALEMTLEHLYDYAKEFPVFSSEEYWSGVTSAMDQSMKVLKLAFNTNTVSEESA